MSNYDFRVGLEILKKCQFSHGITSNEFSYNLNSLKYNKDNFVSVYNSLNNAIIDGITPSMFFYDMHPEFQDLYYLNTAEKQKNIYNAMKYAHQDVQRRSSHKSQPKNSEKRLKYFTFRLVGEYDNWFIKIMNLLSYTKIMLKRIIK